MAEEPNDKDYVEIHSMKDWADTQVKQKPTYKTHITRTEIETIAAWVKANPDQIFQLRFFETGVGAVCYLDDDHGNTVDVTDYESM